jgi:hypothetical protein
MTNTRRNSRRSLGIAATLATLFLLSPAWGWHHLTAHRAINENAIQVFLRDFGSSPKYARSPWMTDYECTGVAVLVPGRVLIEEGERKFQTSVWIREGGYFADEPEWTMALRHFYDPFRASGVAHLTDTVPDGYGNPTTDAKTWALRHPENEDSWEAALQNYRRSMEVEGDDRDRHLARAFRGLGETMHLLADMVQPAHVRNDSHPHSEPIEDTVRVAMVNANGLNSSDPAVQYEGRSIEDWFDILATFTNTRFYSSDTIHDVANGVVPNNDENPNERPQFSDMTLNEAEMTYYATFSVGSIPMIQETLTGYVWRTKFGLPPGKYAWHVPTDFADEHASVLIPIATHACAAAIERFFPTIDLEMTLSSASDEQTKVEGKMVHRIESDPEWTKLGHDAIKYNGPGVLMRSDGLKLADVRFVAGTMEPVTVSVKDKNDDTDYDVYLEVEAGARRFKSEPAPPPGAPPEFPRIYEGTATRTVFVEWEFGGGGSDSSTQTLDVQIKLWGRGSVEGFIGSTPGPYLGHQSTTHEFDYPCSPSKTDDLITLTFDYSWNGQWEPDGSYDMETSFYYQDAMFSGRFTDTEITGRASYPDRTFSIPRPCGSGEVSIQVRVELELDYVPWVRSGND